MQLSAPERIERDIILRILRGELSPGGNLPTVRELGRTYGVNVSTAHRAVARVEKTGLLEVRQGSGMRVLDPRRHGGIALMPLWLEAFRGEPDRVVSLVAEFLELRRAIAVQLLVAHRGAVLAAADHLAALTVALLEARDLSARAHADLALSRAVLDATGNRVAAAFLNTAAQLLAANPLLVDAMYAEPAANALAMGEVVAALGGEGGAASTMARVDEVLAAVDAATMRRYRVLLDAPEPQRDTP